MMVYFQIIETSEDRSKFERLYEEYRGLMYHVAYEILHNQQDAEDAVHQAFLKIAEIIETVDGKICPKTRSYVVTIVENKAIDMYRRKQRYPQEELNPDYVGITIEYEGSNVLTKCMAQLPPRYRAVLLLKHFHGYSSKETARILNLTEANVIKIDQRAKQRLRVLCQEEGIL